MTPSVEQHVEEMGGQFIVPDDRIQAIAEYGMMEARTATGRRPNQRVFRERLAHALTVPGVLATPEKFEPVLCKQPHESEWYPLQLVVPS